MKMDKDFAIVAGVLFVMILLTLAFSTEGISGFYKTSRGLAEYPYEGFSSLQEAYEMREEEDEGFQEGKRNKYSVNSQYKAAGKSVGKLATVVGKAADKAISAAKGKQGFQTKVEGFAGLQSGPVNEQIIGFMYNNEANTTCKGYGYTTSKGNICMSDNDIKLLTTRGMNATGVSDQIGA
jgi:hypothetical protein